MNVIRSAVVIIIVALCTTAHAQGEPVPVGVDHARFEPLVRTVTVICQIVARHSGKRPIIYTTPDFYEQTGIGALNATFWLRSVANHPDAVYPGQDWAFWQYTGTGSVPGIAGKVDINAFRGSPDDFARFAGG